MKCCFFIGHREADGRLSSKLDSVVERLILEEDVEYFYVSGYSYVM